MEVFFIHFNGLLFLKYQYDIYHISIIFHLLPSQKNHNVLEKIKSPSATGLHTGSPC